MQGLDLCCLTLHYHSLCITESMHKIFPNIETNIDEGKFKKTVESAQSALFSKTAPLWLMAVTALLMLSVCLCTPPASILYLLLTTSTNITFSWFNLRRSIYTRLGHNLLKLFQSRELRLLEIPIYIWTNKFLKNTDKYSKCFKLFMKCGKKGFQRMIVDERCADVPHSMQWEKIK